VLRLPEAIVDEIAGLALQAYPYECCGLLEGPPGGAEVARFTPCRNAAESAKVYTIDPHDHLRAERAAEERGHEIVGVVHSHTHTEPYPSPTDVAQAPDPLWWYLIVGLKRDSPELRAYRVVGGVVTEVPITVT